MSHWSNYCPCDMTYAMSGLISSWPAPSGEYTHPLSLNGYPYLSFLPANRELRDGYQHKAGVLLCVQDYCESERHCEL